jgi:hypothetical protein
MVRLFGALAPVALCCLVGCGSSTSVPFNPEVEGILRYRGKPLADVQVQFVPQLEKGDTAPSSSGVTDSEGKFKLSAPSMAGAAIGKHAVLVIQGRPSSAAGKSRDEDGPRDAGGNPQLPAAYRNPASTPVQVTITAEQHSYEIDL